MRVEEEEEVRVEEEEEVRVEEEEEEEVRVEEEEELCEQLEVFSQSIYITAQILVPPIHLPVL